MTENHKLTPRETIPNGHHAVCRGMSRRCCPMQRRTTIDDLFHIIRMKSLPPPNLNGFAVADIVDISGIWPFALLLWKTHPVSAAGTPSNSTPCRRPPPTIPNHLSYSIAMAGGRAEEWRTNPYSAKFWRNASLRAGSTYALKCEPYRSVVPLRGPRPLLCSARRQLNAPTLREIGVPREFAERGA